MLIGTATHWFDARIRVDKYKHRVSQLSLTYHEHHFIEIGLM